MIEVTPAGERPKLRLCPRCGELLERAFEGVVVCLRCDGVWITPATLASAFGTARWPASARSMWWRDQLECPECAADGTTTIMSALEAAGIQVDRCPAHGLWLDHGELGRLLGGEADELAALRARLDGGEADLEHLAQRRAAWRSDIEARRGAAAEYRAWLDAEHRQRRAAQQARDERAIEDRPGAAQRLSDARALVEAEVGRHEAHLVALREQLRAREAELDGARARLRAIDDQLRLVR